MTVLGIDIGGSGVKGALVDTLTGELTSERVRLACPELPKPDEVASLVKEIAQRLEWKGTIGTGFPAVIRDGVAFSAANIDAGFVGLNIATLLHESTGCSVAVINDADAAGIAEMRFGAGRGQTGVVLLLTLGTGIGSAIFINGVLLPNTEFGHLKIRGKDAEKRASATVREKKGYSWKEWAGRLEEVLTNLETIFNLDLIILGGGVSKVFDKYARYLKTQAKLVPAQLLNQAGIVGAACYAESTHPDSEAGG
ncbi:MAG: ROK family protein [Anaerolineaceae bacterium]|nr:ROK family protein [Anaerolineaceae bacterium]